MGSERTQIGTGRDYLKIQLAWNVIRAHDSDRPLLARSIGGDLGAG
jgi:hypothetical protein